MTAIYILLAIVIVALIFAIIILILLKVKNRNQDLSNLSQKDIDKAQEILRLEIKNSNEKISELWTNIESFKDTANSSDKEMSNKIVALDTTTKGFITNINKQDSDFKGEMGQKSKSLAEQLQSILQQITEINGFSKPITSINDNLKSLNDIFTNNSKKRGNIGEYALETILNDMLGDNTKIWERQYNMSNGKRIDAYIKTQDGQEGIGIDAKFPLVNYNNYIEASNEHERKSYLSSFKNDVKAKVTEIESYINVKNNITSAIMFIPSEQIFSFIYSQFADDVISYAFKKKVWICSPTTFSALLTIIDQQSKEIVLNKSIQTIKEKLVGLKNDFKLWRKRWDDILKGFDDLTKKTNNLNVTNEKINKKCDFILGFKDKDLVDDEVKENES